MRKKYWILTIIWLFCIYSTLSIVRPICNFLKETTPLCLLINILLVGLLLSAVIFLWKILKAQKASTYFLLFLAISIYGFAISEIKYPEEKIHFIQYGILSYFIYKACTPDLKRPSAFMAAFILTSIFGWIDEGIQNILPNRYYSNSDVYLNSLSGALGLFLTFIFQREHISQLD